MRVCYNEAITKKETGRVYSIKEYRIPATLEEADTLLHEKKSNTLIAGGMWLHMTGKKIDTAVDLSRAGLDLIIENENSVRIGAMVPLRELEVNPAVSELWNGVLAKAVSPIVGTQFRNSATVGASVFSRFGFSDVITALLALNARVTLYRGGEMGLEEFLNSPLKKDILTWITVPKGTHAGYASLRRSSTDFPVLAVCVSEMNGKHIVSVGARPNKAMRCVKAEACLDAGDINGAREAIKTMPYGTNLRGSAEYRKEMSAVLLMRALFEMGEVPA